MWVVDKKNDGVKTESTFTLSKGGKTVTFMFTADNTRVTRDPVMVRNDVYIAIRGHSEQAFVSKWARYILNEIAPLPTVSSTAKPSETVTLSPAKSQVETIVEKAGYVVKRAQENIVVPYFKPEREARILKASLKRGNNVQITGPSGCGKSVLVNHVAKEEGFTVARMNCSKDVTKDSFVGTMQAKEGETFFQYGILPTAMKNGDWLLVDEIDALDPAYLFTLQAVLEGNGTPLVLTENAGEKIYPHPNFRIIATSNTLGRGDTNGYHGTNVQNIASLDRWTILQLDYSEHEVKILEAIVDDKSASKMLEVAKRIRKAIRSGELPDFVFSTRRLVKWAEALIDPELSFADATEAEVMARLLKEERELISEVIFDSFGVRV